MKLSGLADQISQKQALSEQEINNLLLSAN